MYIHALFLLGPGFAALILASSPRKAKLALHLVPTMNADALSSMRDLLQSKLSIDSQVAQGSGDGARTRLSDTLNAINKLLNFTQQPEINHTEMGVLAQTALGDIDGLVADKVLGDTSSELRVLSQVYSILIPLLPNKTLPSLPRYSRVALPSLDSEASASLSSLAFLHTLVMHPNKIVPSGKSLRSMLASPQIIKALGGDTKAMGLLEKDNGEKRMRDAVTEIAHRAFWDEVRICTIVVPPLQIDSYLISGPGSTLIYIALNTAQSATRALSRSIYRNQ